MKEGCYTTSIWNPSLNCCWIVVKKKKKTTNESEFLVMKLFTFLFCCCLDQLLQLQYNRRQRRRRHSHSPCLSMGNKHRMKVSVHVTCSHLRCDESIHETFCWNLFFHSTHLASPKYYYYHYIREPVMQHYLDNKNNVTIFKVCLCVPCPEYPNSPSLSVEKRYFTCEERITWSKKNRQKIESEIGYISVNMSPFFSYHFISLLVVHHQTLINIVPVIIASSFSFFSPLTDWLPFPKFICLNYAYTESTLIHFSPSYPSFFLSWHILIIFILSIWETFEGTQCYSSWKIRVKIIIIINFLLLFWVYFSLSFGGIMIHFYSFTPCCYSFPF